MKHLILGTAGHVDHGKTALIKALTDIDCDTHKEEKERGITINLGFSHLDLPSGESFGIVDVPGHKDFIKTMVAGAFGIDLVLLVVAADSGIMPQTREHLQIIEMLGIEHGIVVLTKVDIVDDETLELAELEVIEFLEGTKLRDIPVIPVSSLTGKGIPELLDGLKSTIPKVREKKQADRFRMYIDRIFNVKGVGFVVTGSVLEGEISVGKDLFLLPGKSKKIKVRNIERHGSEVDKVVCGDRAALNLSGLKAEDYERGMVLSSVIIESTSMVDASFSLFDNALSLGTWSTVNFYSGTFECLAKMHLLDKENLEPGDKGIIQIHLDKPAILSNKDKFIVRNSSNDITLGGGTIIDNYPLHHKKRTEKLISDLKDLAEATLHSDKIINLVKIEIKKIKAPIFLDDLANKIDKPVDLLLAELETEADPSIMLATIQNKNILLSTAQDSEYRDFVMNAISDWHQRNAILEEGLETTEFIGKLNFATNEAGKLYLDDLMNRLFKEGLTKRAGKSWALAEHQVKIDPRTQEQLQWLENTIRKVGMDKPILADIEKLAHDQKINKEKLKTMIRYLGNQDNLIFYEGEFIHRSVVDTCRKKLLEKVSKKEDGINEKEFRELIDGTKKLIQMLVGIFISEGIVSKKTFYIHITDLGKEIYSKI
ncbi:MAG: selenocysteine-specific translation elongation factor [Bacteroidales bacterium]